MANFTGEIKRDLLRRLPQKRCCRLALLAGFLDTGGQAVVGGGISFTSENEEIAERFLALCEELFHVSMTVTEATRDPKHGRNKLTFSYTGADAGKITEEIAAFGAHGLSGQDCCVSAYLAGAFLGGGSCTLPHGGAKTGYHLEFVFKRKSDAERFLELLDGIQLIGSAIARGEKQIVYCKSREAISDFLFVVGANAALKRFEAVSAAREESNNFNRVSNCYAGNADKTAIASAAQVVALQKMRESGALEALPDSLKSAAYARLESPELSLAELAAKLGIGKSCLNHRMRKLMEKQL